MKGHPEIIDCLNQLLCNEITAGNQFIMHARMLDNWGIKKLGKLEYDASMDEMNHADEVMKRILFLEGVPNVQKIGRIQVGLSVKEVLEADLKCEHINFNDLKVITKIILRVGLYCIVEQIIWSKFLFWHLSILLVVQSYSER